jgi:protein-ribulosamine 3-kinase
MPGTVGGVAAFGGQPEKVVRFLVSMIPAPVRTWLAEHAYGAITAHQPVAGGCINQGARLRTQTGHSFFLKTNAHCPPDMFEREAEGLAALAVPGGPIIPRPLLAGPDFLLLEDLCPFPAVQDYWSLLGQQLATLHNFTSDQFGFDHDNYIGSTPQPNSRTDDGYCFFAEHRLIFQAELAGRNGWLSPDEIRRVVHLANRLPELIPPQPASLLHGDLWSGNLITDAQGHPALIDPAAYFGWGEADLAMMTLFGNPPKVFFHTYQETRPLSPGLEARFPIYHLYHLLNHLNLFGRGYYGQVLVALRQMG